MVVFQNMLYLKNQFVDDLIFKEGVSWFKAMEEFLGSKIITKNETALRIYFRKLPLHGGACQFASMVARPCNPSFELTKSRYLKHSCTSVSSCPALSTTLKENQNHHIVHTLVNKRPLACAVRKAPSKKLVCAFCFMSGMVICASTVAYLALLVN